MGVAASVTGNFDNHNNLCETSPSPKGMPAPTSASVDNARPGHTVVRKGTEVIEVTGNQRGREHLSLPIRNTLHPSPRRAMFVLSIDY